MSKKYSEELRHAHRESSENHRAVAEVVLVGRTAAQVDAINEHGVTVKRDGQETVYTMLKQ